MKAMAASSIGQYENAVRSLDDYYRTVQLGLAACFRWDKSPDVIPAIKQQQQTAIAAIVFGYDQGLVGQFNEAMVDYAVDTLEKLPGKNRLGGGCAYSVAPRGNPSATGGRFYPAELD